MAEVIVIRAILDTEEDVLRDLAIKENANLFDLHKLIVEAFKLDKGEMSSFFESNQLWEQGEEISMMDFDPKSGLNAQEHASISLSLGEVGERMLFIYDFLNLWTFYLEVLDTKPEQAGKNYPIILGGVGERPQEAPQKDMKSDDISEDPYDLGEEEYGEDDESAAWY